MKSDKLFIHCINQKKLLKSIQQLNEIIIKIDTIFMNSENSKTSEPHKLKLKLTDKLDLRIGEKVIALSNLSIYYTWKNIKSSYNNNKFEISVPTWNEELTLPDGSYSLSDIQDYFEYVLKKHRENTDKYGKKLVDTAKKSTTDAIKTASKRVIQKTAEATGDLVGNKIADKITSVSKKSTKKLPTIDEDVELTTPQKRYISPEERQQITDELRLVPRNY